MLMEIMVCSEGVCAFTCVMGAQEGSSYQVYPLPAHKSRQHSLSLLFGLKRRNYCVSNSLVI